MVVLVGMSQHDDCDTWVHEGVRFIELERRKWPYRVPVCMALPVGWVHGKRCGEPATETEEFTLVDISD